ncbi:hypothetical protein WCE41_05040 [Luteimonas sp. MJ246]|uniref:hypothetical protein n=1 Tax=Luteimonas sp. MJ174 TaxID=3129237 RepID=UPI0031BBB03C
MRRARPSRTHSPARRILLRGLVLALLVSAGLYGYAWYRDWQLRDSCTGNAGEWNAELEQCTFRLPLPEQTAPDPTP